MKNFCPPDQCWGFSTQDFILTGIVAVVVVGILTICYYCKSDEEVKK